MTALRRAAILKLASVAYEMDLDVVNGTLTQDDDGRWKIGSYDLIEHFLKQHEGEELVLVLGSLADERPIKPRTCRTCGRDYIEMECPHCRANRLRLRGR